MMKPELFDSIELLIDIPEENLQAGERGAIVEDYGNAYEVEFANSDGETLALLALTPDQFIVTSVRDKPKAKTLTATSLSQATS